MSQTPGIITQSCFIDMKNVRQAFQTINAQEDRNEKQQQDGCGIPVFFHQRFQILHLWIPRNQSK